MSKLKIALASLGALCLIAAALLAWLITPQWVARVPDDRTLNRSYEGTFQTLFDPRALAQGDLVGAVKVGLPLAIAQVVKVEKTSGDTALINDDRTTTAAGQPVEHTQWSYAVDRYSLEAVSSHPSDWQVVPAQGLVVGWPLGAEKKTYQGWVPETQTTSPVTYVRTEQKQGMTTYVYHGTVPPTKIADSQVLASLPKTLPRALFAEAAASGALPPALGQSLGAVLTRLPDPVPMEYTFQDDSTFWVDPTTGLVIDVQRAQKRTAEIAVPGAQPLPFLPVVAVTYQDTAASAKNAADQARSGQTAINWLGVYLPIILLVVGVVLLVAVFALWGRGRRTAVAAGSAGSAGGSAGAAGAAGGAVVGGSATGVSGEAGGSAMPAAPPSTTEPPYQPTEPPEPPEASGPATPPETPTAPPTSAGAEPVIPPSATEPPYRPTEPPEPPEEPGPPEPPEPPKTA